MKLAMTVVMVGALVMGCAADDATREEPVAAGSESALSTSNVYEDVIRIETFSVGHTNQRIELTRASGTFGTYARWFERCEGEDRCEIFRESGSFEIKSFLFGWSYSLSLSPDGSAMPKTSYAITYVSRGPTGETLARPVPTLVGRDGAPTYLPPALLD